MKNLILVLSVLFIFLRVGTPAHADTFPRDAFTKTTTLTGASTYTFEAGHSAKTILGVTIMQSGQASDTVLQCGSTTFMRNYAKDTPSTQMQYRCSDTLSVTKTGNDNSFINVTYVMRDIATQSAVLGQTVDIATTSAIYTGMYAQTGLNFVMAWIIAIGVGWYIGNWLYKR